MKVSTKLKAWLLKKLTNKKNNSFDILKAKSVLVLRYDRIGDMIVSTPIFRELKKEFPYIKISVLASKVNSDVIRNNPNIDEIYLNYKNSFFKDLPVLIKLRKKRFDVCIELENSVIPHAIIRLLIIKPKKIISIHKDGRYGVKGNELELYDFFTKKDNKSHFSKIWLDTLIFFGINSKVINYDFYISKHQRERAQLFSKSIGNFTKIGINLEGSFKEKKIQKKDLDLIIHGLHKIKIDIKIVLLSKPDKNYLLHKIVSDLKMDFVLPSYITYSINDVAALVNELDLIISPDTSIVHVAGAFNKPVISIHENNHDSFRLWSPISSLNRTVFAKTSYGIEDYNVDDVVIYAKELINKMESEK